MTNCYVAAVHTNPPPSCPPLPFTHPTPSTHPTPPLQPPTITPIGELDKFHLSSFHCYFFRLSVIQRPDSLIEIRQGSDFHPLCAADFPREMGDAVCRMLGKRHLVYLGSQTLEGVTSYVTWTGESKPEDDDALLLKVFIFCCMILNFYHILLK